MIVSLAFVAALAAASPAAEAQLDPCAAAESPMWLRRPASRHLAHAYPRAALNERLAGLTATSCTVRKDGSLADCITVEEDPPGHGFGEAALSLMNLFHMQTRGPNGQSSEGGVIKIPIRFTLAPDVRTPPLQVRYPPLAGASFELNCRYRERQVDNCFVGSGSAPADVRNVAVEALAAWTMQTQRPVGRLLVPVQIID